MRTAGYPAQARPGWRAGAAVLAGVALVFGVPPAAAAQSAVTAVIRPAASRTVLPGYVPLWAQLQAHGGVATADLGPAPATAAIGARVYLAGRDPHGLAAYARAVSDPRGPLYHHYLSPVRLQQRFGATRQQVTAVVSWLSAAGLHITATTEHYIAVSGTAAAAERAFSAVWHSYSDGFMKTTIQQAPAPAERLTAPARVAAAVLTVAPTQTGSLAAAGASGASDPTGTPGSASSSSASSSASANAPCSAYFGQRRATTLPPAYGRTAPYRPCGYTPQQLRSAYAVPPQLIGEGVTVAVVSSWRIPTAAQDITTFARQHGQPLRPGQFTQILPAGLDTSCEDLESLGLQAGSEEVGPSCPALPGRAPAAVPAPFSASRPTSVAWCPPR